MTVAEKAASMGATAIEAAYGTLKRDIIAGVRKPGERLRIAMLSKTYDFGPSPLREALQRLSSDGLVTVSERRGFQVAELSSTEFVDINFARIEVETLALRLSIEHGGEAWEAAVVAAAYQLDRADRRLAEEPDAFDAWEKLNARFHREIISGCPSTTLIGICERLNEHVERYRRASVVRSGAGRDIAKEHADIATATLERDAEAAVRLLRQHFQLTADALLGGAISS
jgi:GntR family transcriptional regulator, carbon starvation induced regulator